MRFSTLSFGLFSLTGVVLSAAVEKRDLLQDLQNQALQALKEAESSGTIAKRDGCTIHNAVARRDW